MIEIIEVDEVFKWDLQLMEDTFTIAVTSCVLCTFTWESFISEYFCKKGQNSKIKNSNSMIFCQSIAYFNIL